METLEFQSEVSQLLQLMIHSVYSNRDTFLRELISNASDALDKLRLETFRDKTLEADISDLRIELEIDEEARTLTVRDNGIGMSRDDVVSLIGTIAKSGTADFLQRLREAPKGRRSRKKAPEPEPARDQELIGQFGIGFYSSFMVADKVTLVTRHPRSSEGVRWESTGEGTYTIEEIADVPVGTEVTLHLKPADEEDQLPDYTSDWLIKSIVRRYSDFITWPVRLGDETVNSRKALWARPASEVTEEEYGEFYRHVSHDWNAPLETISVHAEGTFEYQALLFLPSNAPADLFLRERSRGLQLYVRRVFVMEECAELLPDYLRFVRGVVDAADLSLNVSREILQQDRQIELMRRRLTKKVLQTIKSMMADKPESYTTLWRELGKAIKEGLLNDYDNRESILAICSFATSHSSTEPTTLADYVSRMKDDQDAIYYLTGDSRTTMEQSPHLEALRAKGFEVLFLTDSIDEMWLSSISDFAGQRFQSAAKGDVDLETEEEKTARAEQEDDYAGFLEWMRSVLQDHVKQVRLSSRLTTSAACIVSEATDMSPSLEKMYRSAGQDLPRIKRILELNPVHPLISGLRSAHTAGRDDLADGAELVHGMALLAEGGELADPARFARLLADRLPRSF